MAYSTGIMDKRVTILTRSTASSSSFGNGSAGYTYDETATIWAAVDWTRGTKSMKEGALDAYDTIMVRTRYRSDLTRDCRLEYEGKSYNIDSFHADKRGNTIQITATELTSGNS